MLNNCGLIIPLPVSLSLYPSPSASAQKWHPLAVPTRRLLQNQRPRPLMGVLVLNNSIAGGGRDPSHSRPRRAPPAHRDRPGLPAVSWCRLIVPRRFPTRIAVACSPLLGESNDNEKLYICQHAKRSLGMVFPVVLPRFTPKQNQGELRRRIRTGPQNGGVASSAANRA